MKNHLSVLSIILIAILYFPNSAKTNESGLLLSSYVKYAEPWLQHEANSEQRHPMYVGATPREMVFEGKTLPRPALRSKLKRVGTDQALKITKTLKESQVELEAWPFQNDDGDQAWAFARWRRDRNDAWKWLEEDSWRGRGSFEDPAPALPQILRPWIASERNALFKDFLEMESLYDKPLFGDAIWTSKDGMEILGAWYPLIKQDEIEEKVTSGREYLARVLPQPARFNSDPISFIIRIAEGEVRWPTEIDWQEVPDTLELSATALGQKIEFPDTYGSEYREWIEKLAGEDSPFKRKNSTDPKNELEQLADYLQAYYEKELGLKTDRHRFKYRGFTQSNVTAILPGSLPPGKNRPILFADHYDTAYEEDTFESTGRRVATAGANDNVTATASLLMAAKLLKDARPKHDIWFVHFTGEEYPADDLGARKYLGKLLKEKTDIQGLVLIDLIGYRKKTNTVFQINLGRHEDSKRFGRSALSAAEKYASRLDPKIRGRFDERSYLYNTDGYIFSNLGFPVIYFNEHLNRKNMSGNIHYHQSSDKPRNVDFTYAVPISQAAIATLWELAND